MCRVDLGEILDRREHMGETTIGVGTGDRRPRHAAGVGAGRLERHLLAEHHPQRQFVLVDGSRNPLPRRLGDQRARVRVGAERVDDGLGIRVEVEQPSAAGDRGGEIAEVVQHESALHMVGLRCEADDSVAVGQSQRPSVPAVAHFLDARHALAARWPKSPS